MRPRSAPEALLISSSNSIRPSWWFKPAVTMLTSSPTPMSRRRKRSWVRMMAVKPATRVPSRSKNAPISGPGGLAMISATEPGSRRSRGGFFDFFGAHEPTTDRFDVSDGSASNEAGTACGAGSPANARISLKASSRHLANSFSSRIAARS